MAFTQNNGNPVSFIGTDGRDTIVLTNGTPITGVTNGSGTWTGGPAFIDGLGDNDLITFNGNSNSVTVNGGSGDDQVTLNGSGDVGQFTSGQVFAGAGNDTVIYNNLVFSGINGNDGNDTILAGSGAGSTGSSINGNSGSDFIFIQGSLGNTGVYGGQDDDTLQVITGANFVLDSVINGNKGNDTIIVDSTGANFTAWSGTEVRGGQGDDFISALEMLITISSATWVTTPSSPISVSTSWTAVPATTNSMVTRAPIPSLVGMAMTCSMAAHPPTSTTSRARSTYRHLT